MDNILEQADLLAAIDQYWHQGPGNKRILDAIQDEYGLVDLSLPYSQWNLPR